MTPAPDESLAAEVERVAAAFQSWFGGEGDAEEALDRIAAAFHPDFVTVAPDGALSHREDVLARLAGARGAKGAGFRIAIEDVRALPSPGPGLSLVTYLERQGLGREGGDLRRSTALLRDAAPRWLLVHETTVAATRRMPGSRGPGAGVPVGLPMGETRRDPRPAQDRPMPQPVRLLGLSGSLRKASNSTAILRAVADAMGERGTLTIHDLRAIPPYDGDLDGEVKPEPVRALKEAVAAADGVILITPEYNYAMSGVLKNAVDWASRPAYGSPFKGKPVLPMTSSGGIFGGVRAMSGMVDVLTGMLCRLTPSPHIAVPQAGAKVKDGRMEDAQTLALCLAGVDLLIGEIELLRKAA